MIAASPYGLPGLAGLPGQLVGAEAAFYVVFGIFVIAFVVLVVVTMRWAVRRDRTGRAQWLRRQEHGAPPPVGNGRRPSGTRERQERRRKPPG